MDFDAREHAAPHWAEHSATKARWPETVLLIGDKVETDPPRADEGFVHELDLGRAWKDLTGLPFVYAAWMCRAGEEDSVGVRSAAEVLDRNRLHNQTRLDHLVCASAKGRGWSIEHAGEYLGGLLRYEIGPREGEAVERFLAMAHEMGLVRRRDVRWAEV
jgi:chorismate dehydratase